MNNLIIWSKDRACQLHLLLESLDKYSEETFSSIYVIYTYSSEFYKKGYSLVKDRFPKVSLLKQEDSFRNETLKCLSQEADNIAFSTDDTVCFKKFNLKNLKLKDDVYSLRLGLNTIIQNHIIGSLQPPLNRYVMIDNNITWNHLEYSPVHNYGYPGALDLHLFNREKIYKLAANNQFKNTNELESLLFNHRHEFTRIISGIHSAAVNIPCNNLSNITAVNLNNKETIESLNKKYMDGYVISLPLIARTRIIGCHQDIPFTMVKYG